ncbi:MAG: hypothetical protein LAT67_09070 [Balneolales bacterium]|nr:hypothetical protein [Balneolales bacterium]
MMRKKLLNFSDINIAAVCVCLCLSLCITFALPSESKAQRSDTFTERITWPSGDRNNNGFTSASIEMFYQFGNCYGNIRILYQLDSNSLTTSNTYWFNGEERTVPAENLPESRSSIRFSGQVLAGGSQRIGDFSDDYAGTFGGAGCLGQNSPIADFSDVAPNADTEEKREQFLRSLTLNADRPDGPLVHRDVEAYFNRIDGEERRREQQEQRERAQAEREAERERQREERERAEAEREAEREREREERERRGSAGVGAGAGAGAAGATASGDTSSRSDSDDESSAASPEETSDAFDSARAAASVAEAQAEADRQQARARQSAEFTAAAIFVHYFIGKHLYSNIGKEYPGTGFVTPGPAIFVNFGYGLSSIPTFYNRNINGTERTTNHPSTTFDLGLMFELYPYFSRNMAYKAEFNVHVGHGLLIQDFSASVGGGLHGYLGDELFQLYGMFDLKYLARSYDPWLIDGESGGIDEVSFTQYTIGLGPQFTWDGRINRKNVYNRFRLLGTITRTPNQQAVASYPVTLRWAPGIMLEYDSRNHYRVYAKIISNYQRQGQVNHSFTDNASISDVAAFVGFKRRISTHVNVATYHRSSRFMYNRLRNYDQSVIHLPQVGFNMLGLSRNYHSSLPGLSLKFLGYSRHRTLNERLGFGVVYGAEIFVNRYNLDENRTSSNEFRHYQRTTRYGLNIPVTLRYSLPREFNRYFVDLGFSGSVGVYDEHWRATYDNRINRLRGRTFSDVDSITPELNRAFLNYRVGIGAVVPLSSRNMYAGFVFERPIQSISDDARIIPNTFLLSVGLSL